VKKFSNQQNVSKMDTKRIFAAIEIPPELRKSAGDLIGELRSIDNDKVVRWEISAKMHITLKFIADADETATAIFKNALDDIAKQHRPFTAEIKGSGVFPDQSKARVYWFGIGEGEAEIKSIANEIESACRVAGLPAEKREFHPHLTAGRVRDSRRAMTLTQQFLETAFTPEPFVVSRLVLIESKLLPSGSEYSLLSHHYLTHGF
jgi:RNA 2',3'-cyclic 3'-phosphodiesterase